MSEHIKAGYLGSVTPLAPEGEIWQEWREAQVRISELENEVERLGEIVTQCDGIECAKHDVMVRGAIAELKAAEAQAAAFKEENERLRGVLQRIVKRVQGCTPIVATDVREMAQAALRAEGEVEE